MKYLFVIIMIVATLVQSSYAQDSDITLTTTELPFFGLQADLPEWQNAGPGAYRRGSGSGDFATIIVQSARLDRDRLIQTLLPRLGIEELPDVTQELTTDSFTWDIFIFDINAQGIDISIYFAVSENDGSTHIVILQVPPEEAEMLGDEVFFPVVNSVAPLVEEAEDTSELPYISEEVSFTNGEITLAGTLTIPEGDAPYPAIVLMSGSGAQDRNESLAAIGAEIEPFREIADHLTRNGFAVLRYDDRGYGESAGDFASATLFDFADDASAAVIFLASRDDIDSAKIGLLGHSEGGMIAPYVAMSNDTVSFIIGMAAPALSYRDILLAQNRALYSAAGVDEATTDIVVDAVDTFLGTIVEGDEDTIRETLSALLLLQTGSEPDAALLEQTMSIYMTPYWATGVTFNPSDYWAELDIPALMVYGGKDLQVPAEQSAPVMETLLADRDDSEVVVIDDANHIFQAADTGLIGEYATLEQMLMPEFLETISDWLTNTITVE